METGISRHYSWRFKLLAVGGAILAGLLLAEGAMRVRQWLKYGTLTPSVNRFVTHEPSGLRIPVPGLDTGRIRIDSLGFRNDELAQPKPDGLIRIAFLGASTTYCAEVSGNQAAWPELVVRELRERHPDRRFDCVNGGVPGYAVSDSRKNLEARIRPLDPDVIIIYHATNDLCGETRRLAEQAGLFSGRAADPSFLARASVLWHWIEKNYEVWSRQRASLSAEGRLEIDPDRLGAEFRDQLESLVQAADEVADVVAVATFSTQVRRDQDPDQQLRACNTSLYYMPYMTVGGLLDGFESYNRAIRETAGVTGAVLIEAENSIPGNPDHFADSVHLTDAGCRAMAVRVVAALRRDDRFRALVEPGSD